MTITLGRSALVTVNLVIALGADFEAAFRYSAGKPATPVDLTGWTARAVIRDRPANPPWIVLTSGDQITLSSDGRILIRIPHATTNTATWDGRTRARWVLRLTDPTGNRIRFAEGEVTIAADMAGSG